MFASARCYWQISSEVALAFVCLSPLFSLPVPLFPGSGPRSVGLRFALPVAQVRPRCVRGVPVSRPRSCRSRALVSRSSCAGPFPLILYNKVSSLPLPRPFRCPCRFFNPLYCSRLRLASGIFFKKSPPFVLPVSRKRVPLHPLSGTEAAMFERFSPFSGLGPEKNFLGNLEVWR